MKTETEAVMISSADGSGKVPASDSVSSEPRPKMTAVNAATLVIALLILYGLPTLVVGYVINIYFKPQISEDFLFLYFSIVSALTVAVWSTFVLAEHWLDKRLIFMVSILFNGATFSALVSVVAGPGQGRFPLVVSLTFVAVGLGYLMIHSASHTRVHWDKAWRPWIYDESRKASERAPTAKPP